MLFVDLASTLDHVRATRSRKVKITALAGCLSETPVAEVAVVAGYLSGQLRQRRTGVGWRSLADLPAPAAVASLGVADVDAAFEAMANLSGPGSQSARLAALNELFSQASAPEQQLLRALLTSELRTGALESVVLDAAAVAFDVGQPLLRRAAMLAGSAPIAIAAVAAEGAPGAASIGLQVGRPVQPMLAGSAADLAAAVNSVGLPCLVDGKLDGIRIQVHKSPEGIRIASRSLDDLTDRLGEVRRVVAELPVDSVVLDGEALLIGADGRARAFQETASVSMTRAGAPGETGAVMTPYFFDVLHLNGTDLIDRSAGERDELLQRLLPPALLVPRILAHGLGEAEAFNRQVLDQGLEGVVVKSLDSVWEAGRRGSGWVKVKPRHTLDLVVLAVERGSGRRRGTLSNIHLGARTEDGFVMLGKTFKGMTDEILAWQTRRFTELQTDDDGWVVTVRPEQVVEIAFDGVQRSSRYPGGVALRFARVLRYREDKSAAEADTIDAVLAHLPTGVEDADE